MAYTDMWEIQDNNGTIHSGPQEEMETAFTVMRLYYAKSIADELSISKEEADDLIEKWICDWSGDLRLVQIHDVYR